jgi:hypothetical protein
MLLVEQGCLVLELRVAFVARYGVPERRRGVPALALRAAPRRAGALRGFPFGELVSACLGLGSAVARLLCAPDSPLAAALELSRCLRLPP